MTIVERGIAELKAGHREEAEKLFAEGCFLGGDSVAAGYLSMIYFDEKVTNRTEESVSVARLLWAMTQDERPSAAHRLGVQYLSSGKSDVRKKGADLVRKADAQNYPNACCVSGILYYQAGDYDRAASSFSRYPRIMTDKKPLKLYAECLEKKSTPEYIKAAECYKEYAEKFDDPEALIKASDLFCYNGEYEKGVECLIRVPGDKTPEQYERIGEYYLYTGTTDEELRKAYQYLHFAEQNGCGNDSFLGMIEEKFGRVREAYAYYCRAWENGSFDTCSELLLLILRTRKSDPAIDKEWPEERLVKLILDAQNVSESSRRKLENSDLYPEIAGILARAYYEGIYVPRDKAKTCEYAGKGPDNPVCIYYFGMIIIDGILSDTNPEDGINYINQAAMSGYSEALYTMGGFYADDQNWTKALDFYMRAYSAGCKKAAAQIATMYEEGYVGTVLGMPNKRKAMSWRQKSQ